MKNIIRWNEYNEKKKWEHDFYFFRQCSFGEYEQKWKQVIWEIREWIEH